MAVTTTTAALIGAGVAAGTTAYSANKASKDAKFQAKQQADALAKSAEETRKQSQLSADQAVEQTRQAQERAKVSADLEASQATTPEKVELDVGTPDDTDTPQRRRRAYQSTSAPGGSIRI